MSSCSARRFSMSQKHTRFKDITNQKFNRLTVLRISHSKNKVLYWLCRCDCGNYTTVASALIRTGRTRSCGCAHRDCLIERNKTHGKSKTRTHRIWLGMLSRCNNPNRKAYPDYGGRGISVCNEWLDFSNFFSDMGEAPEGMTIERRDNDGHYTKENCYWATPKQQARNRRSSRLVSIDGVTKSLAEWADDSPVQYHTIKRRLNAGWKATDALSIVPAHLGA